MLYQAVWSPNPDLLSPAPFNLSQSQQCYLHMWQYPNFLFCSTSPGTILSCAYRHVENNLWKNKGICIHNLSSVGPAAKWVGCNRFLCFLLSGEKGRWKLCFRLNAAVMMFIILKLFPMLLWVIHEDVWMLFKHNSETGRLAHKVMVLTCKYSCQ